jgi:hypothetical protein
LLSPEGGAPRREPEGEAEDVGGVATSTLEEMEVEDEVESGA